MNRRKIVLLFAPLIILACALAAFFIISADPINKNHSQNSDQNSISPRGISNTASLPALRSSNAFVSKGNSNIAFPQNPNSAPLSPTDSGSPGGADNTKATSLHDVQSIIASTFSAGKPVATTTSLTLPVVPDSEIVISSSGASTILNYLAYFGAHAKNIAFDGKKFDSGLKDKNGIVLFTPTLINKAVVDDNFSEIAGSLSVQKEFIEAEIDFLKSIPVTGAVVAVNKKNIGLEQLMIRVIDKALAVSSGSISKADFINYYNQFNATAATARQNFTAQSGILSLGKPVNFFSQILNKVGFGTAAQAQTVDTPFGGTIIFLQPCPCDLGVNIIIGPPVPADLFVPIAFLATPLFFDYKMMDIGVWWLGLYDAELQIPCAQLPICEPTDLGGEIIMTGTSLIP